MLIELSNALELEYYAILAANPGWEATYWEFLASRGFSRDEIAECYGEFYDES